MASLHLRLAQIEKTRDHRVSNKTIVQGRSCTCLVGSLIANNSLISDQTRYIDPQHSP